LSSQSARVEKGFAVFFHSNRFGLHGFRFSTSCKQSRLIMLFRFSSAADYGCIRPSCHLQAMTPLTEGNLKALALRSIHFRRRFLCALFPDPSLDGSERIQRLPIPINLRAMRQSFLIASALRNAPPVVQGYGKNFAPCLVLLNGYRAVRSK